MSGCATTAGVAAVAVSTGRRVGVGAQDGLSADHDDLFVVRDVYRGADEGLELLAVHFGSVVARASRQIFQRVAGSSTPAHGEV